MGYCMDQVDCVFEMPKENADKALAAIKELLEATEPVTTGSPSTERNVLGAKRTF